MIEDNATPDPEPRCDYEQRSPTRNDNRPYCELGFCPTKLVNFQCGVKRS